VQIDIRPSCDGWAWFLIDPEHGPEAVGSSRLFLTHREAVESAQKLMLAGVTSILDQHRQPPRDAQKQRNTA
jgi:hypothetical protein